MNTSAHAGKAHGRRLCHFGNKAPTSDAQQRRPRSPNGSPSQPSPCLRTTVWAFASQLTDS